ncbi:MAG: ABC transporter substrate-binding protein [Symploca sp. SIO1C2]|nr:ABC transporter substrate-binding protein [Symploca sp. SIO1C2]NER48071.1 ABC transporter substrate-binding protein [Symploca sp. SIO1A3]
MPDRNSLLEQLNKLNDSQWEAMLFRLGNKKIHIRTDVSPSQRNIALIHLFEQEKDGLQRLQEQLRELALSQEFTPVVPPQPIQYGASLSPNAPSKVTQLPKKRQPNRNKLRIAFGSIFILSLLGGGIFWQQYIYCPVGQDRVSGECMRLEITSGESRLFLSQNNFNLDSGIDAFAKQDYDRAKNFFQSAIEAAPNDPVPQIYFNNAQARQQSELFQLAVVVPVDNNEDSAEVILKGIADAQTKFNDSDGKDNRLLEIVIANDHNEQEIARKVAQKLVAKKQVLGVIGHNSSNASEAALPVYEQAGLAMVSATSTSTSLKGDVFFRTVPSDRVAGKKLADYAKNTLNLDQLVIFSDSQSIYSKSLKDAFEGEFKKLGGKVVRNVDLTAELNAKAEIERSANQDQVKGVVLLPSVKTDSVAISIARANYQLPQNQRLQLLGGDALYVPETLEQGSYAVEGLVLSVAWFGGTSEYAKTAENRWGGKIDWRTANSYDATQALIKTLSNNATRETVVEDLKNKVRLSCTETSGERLRFWASGDPDRESRLVQVTKDAPASSNSALDFKEIQQGESNASECNW